MNGHQIIDAVIRASALDGAIPHKDGSFTFVWAENAAEQIEAAMAETEPRCTWTHHRSYGGDYTECGEWFYLTHEWTQKFKFCPYCGGRISLASKDPTSD
jgi:hypothetical protein